nr:hypothetical protein [Tanacetum cinerariifolium]
IHTFWKMFKQLHINITLVDALILMTKYRKMLKALLSNKEKLQELVNTPLNENCSAEFADELPLEYDDNLQFDIESDLKEIEFLLYQDKDSSLKDSIDQKNHANLADMVDALPLTNNEDKIFNPGIFIQEKPVEIITHVVQDKKLEISNASLVLEDFDPPFYEPLFFKEVLKSKMLLPSSSENEKKVFKPGIHTSEKVHSYFIPELSHQGYKVFKIN